MRVWSDPRDPAQSRDQLLKVDSVIAALLYQVRLMVESCSWSMPFLVTMPGSLAKVSRLLIPHSSSLSAHCEGGMSCRDQDWECVLKSPTTSIGIVGSRSSSSSMSSAVLSLMSL